MQGSNLTAREHEILIWVSRGKTNSEVAAILWISASTVRKHLENIYAKLGVSNRAGAVGVLLGEFSSAPLRVFGVRTDDADQPPALVVEDLPGSATSAAG